MKTWRPNQSGTFSNRTNFADTQDNKLFVVDHCQDDPQKRAYINAIIGVAPEMFRLLPSTLKTLQTLLDNEDLSLFAKELIRIEMEQISSLVSAPLVSLSKRD